MRMSQWTPQVIHFMEDASRASSYFCELGSIVRDALPQGGRLVDAGCGMGQLSLALSPYAASVDAIDCSANAVSYLANAAALRGCANVRVLRDDMLAPTRLDGRLDKDGYAFDLAVFCLSARFAEAYEAARRMRARRVLVINKVHSQLAADRSAQRARAARTRPAPAEECRPLVHDYDECLAKNRLVDPRCTGFMTSLEYGQPFRNLDEAVVYFRLFRTRSFPGGITPPELDRLLVHTGDDLFPYYLPNTRHLAFFLCALDNAQGRDSRATCGVKGGYAPAPALLSAR